MAASAPPTTMLRPERVASNHVTQRRPSTALRELAEAKPYGVLQAKLTVGPANDRFEREADAVADRVLRMEGAPAGVDPARPAPPATLQRLCHKCEEETHSGPDDHERDEVLQPQSDGALSAHPLDAETVDSINAMRGGGQPLPLDERSFFEPRFGRDFSQVRIHADAAAGAAARAIGARAFTFGGDVAFAPGHYRPGTASGRHLLAHELTHVVQQGAAEPLSTPAELEFEAPEPIAVAGEAGAVQRAGDPTAIPPGFACPTDLTPGAPAGTDVVFPVDDATITPAHTTLLTTFRTSWLASGGVDDVTVHGYASVDGDQGHNWTLSCNRARAVEGELLRLGIPAVRISVLAHGESTDFGSSAGPNRHAVVSSSAPGLIQLPLLFGILTPRDDFTGRSTSRFGVGEVIDLSFLSLPPRPAADFGGLEWRIAAGGGTLAAVTDVGTATYTAPATADAVRLELRIATGATAGRVVSTRSIAIVEPASVRMVMAGGSAPGFSPGGPIAAGLWGAGFLADVFVNPRDVSFQGVVFGEGTVAAVITPPGSFLAPFAAAHPTNTFGPGHGGNATTGTPVSPPRDQIFSGSRGPAATLPVGSVCGVSDFLWAIPWEFSVAGGPRTRFPAGFTANHHATSTLLCNATIEKGGAGPFCRRIDGTTC